MPGRNWSEIPQESWENINVQISEDDRWFLEFDYIGRNRVHYHYPREEIEWEDFLDIYDQAIELNQEVEVEY